MVALCWFATAGHIPLTLRNLSALENLDLALNELIATATFVFEYHRRTSAAMNPSHDMGGADRICCSVEVLFVFLLVYPQEQF